MRKNRIALVSVFALLAAILLMGGNSLASTSSDYTLVDNNNSGGVTITFNFATTSGATFEYSTDSGQNWSTIVSLGWAGGGTLTSPAFNPNTQISFAVSVGGTRYTTQEAAVADLFDNGMGGSAMWITNGSYGMAFQSAFWTVQSGDTIAKSSAVPLPPSAFLFGSGLLGLIGMGSKKRKSIG